MRLVLAFSVLAVSALGAKAAEDRYGPPRARTGAPAAASTAPTAPTGALPASAAPYSGQTLNWSGKVPAVTPQSTSVAARPQAPQPIAPWAGQAPGPQRPPAYPSIAAPVQAPLPAGYTSRPPQAVQPPIAQPLPTNLYDRAPAPAAVQAAAPQVQPQTPPPPPPAMQPNQPYPAPRPQAAALPPSPSTPQRVGAPDEARPRAYSVVREFGGVPDPINIPPPTSYWATRPETAPPPEEADTREFAEAGGVGAQEVAEADGPTPEEAAARRREREKADARAAAAAAAKGAGK